MARKATFACDRHVCPPSCWILPSIPLSRSLKAPLSWLTASHIVPINRMEKKRKLLPVQYFPPCLPFSSKGQGDHLLWWSQVSGCSERQHRHVNNIRISRRLSPYRSIHFKIPRNRKEGLSVGHQTPEFWKPHWLISSAGGGERVTRPGRGLAVWAGRSRSASQLCPPQPWHTPSPPSQHSNDWT